MPISKPKESVVNTEETIAEAKQEKALADAEEAKRMKSPAYRLWKQTLDVLSHELKPDVFSTWLSSTSLTITKNSYTINTPNTYTRDWLQNRLAGSIKRALGSVGGDDLEIIFSISPKGKKGR